MIDTPKSSHPAPATFKKDNKARSKSDLVHCDMMAYLMKDVKAEVGTEAPQKYVLSVRLC